MSNNLLQHAATQEDERPQRARRRPAWITNYEVTGIDQSEDPALTHFALFLNCDPPTFEAAVRESKCGGRQWMKNCSNRKE